MLGRRRLLGVETCLGHSLRIQERFVQVPQFLRAARVALYSPFLNEVFTEEIFTHARQVGKTVYFPRVVEDGLEFVEVEEFSQMRPGAYKILEPRGTSVCCPRDIDIMAVPGAAFDLQGGRLGYGQGYYDRALFRGGRPSFLVGLCFDFQFTETLPVEEHDIRMDAVISEERFIEIDPAGFPGGHRL